MKTILVSGASGVIGYGILRSLRHLPDVRLIGTTIYDDSVAPAFCDLFELAPKTSDDNYLDWLCQTIKKYKVDLIIPGIEIDLEFWNKMREEIIKTETYILLNSSSLIELCADKWNFYEKLHATGSNLVIDSVNEGNFDSLRQKFGLPFLMKPRHGSASKGIVIINNEDTFNQHVEKLGSTIIAQPIVGNNDSEYTASAFFDKQSNLCCQMTLKRKLSTEGFTEKAQVIDLPDIKQAIKELAAIFRPVGPTNFQFRYHQEQIKLLEINPRISSATSIRAGFGYNESVMSVEYFLDNKTPAQPALKRGYAVRYMEDCFFYDSNTL